MSFKRFLGLHGGFFILGVLSWFWLPPWSLWQPWARQGLESVAKKMALKGHFLDEFR
jgi:hypothetical protein